MGKWEEMIKTPEGRRALVKQLKKDLQSRKLSMDVFFEKLSEVNKVTDESNAKLTATSKPVNYQQEKQLTESEIMDEFYKNSKFTN